MDLVEEIIRTRPQDSMLLTEKGFLLWTMGKVQEASAVFEQAMRFDGRNMTALRGNLKGKNIRSDTLIIIL